MSMPVLFGILVGDRLDGGDLGILSLGLEEVPEPFLGLEYSSTGFLTTFLALVTFPSTIS